MHLRALDRARHDVDEELDVGEAHVRRPGDRGLARLLIQKVRHAQPPGRIEKPPRSDQLPRAADSAHQALVTVHAPGRVLHQRLEMNAQVTTLQEAVQPGVGITFEDFRQRARDGHGFALGSLIRPAGDDGDARPAPLMVR